MAYELFCALAVDLRILHLRWSDVDTKKPRIAAGLMVVKAGLEPARRLKHKILNLACLPIPPLDQVLELLRSRKAKWIGAFFQRSTPNFVKM